MPAKDSEQRKPARDESRPGARDDSRKGAGDDSAKGAAGFEKRLERLEQLAERLREGSIPLEEAVSLFEEGMKLSKGLEKELARVERRVEILTREPGESDDPAAEPGLELFPELGEDEKS